MRRRAVGAAVTVLLLAAALPGTARGAEGERTRVEVGPYIGYRVGGSFHDDLTGERLDIDETAGYGLTIGVSLGEGDRVEFLYSRQPSRVIGGDFLTGASLFDLDVSYYHIGGAYDWDYGRIRPFLAASLGATHLDPQGPGLHSETRFSASLGFGVTFMAHEHLGFRLHGRGFATFIGDNTSIFCTSAGGGASCAVQVQGDVLTQFEVGAGLLVVF